MMDHRWADFEPHQASSNNTAWVQCFNATASHARYAEAIYGSRFAPLDWSRLDVIYPRLLLGLNKTCLLDSEHVYRREIMGSIFVDYPERTHVANGVLINRGGQRLDMSRPPPIRLWPWVEVMHGPHYGVSSQDAQGLWMYLARGTGVWFNPGRVLAVSDAWDLAVYLNRSTTYNPRIPGAKTALIAHAKERLAGTFDSISFLFHIDGGCCQRMVMRELVSLHNFSSHCPVSPRFMRRGHPPDHLRRCNCTSHLHLANSHICG